MRFVFFFLIAFGVLLLGYGYIGLRLIASSKLNPPWNMVAWLGLVLLLILPIGAMVFGRSGSTFAGIIGWIGFTALGLASFIFILTISRDVILLIFYLVKWFNHFFQSSSSGNTASIIPGRRESLMQISSIAVMGAAVLFTGYGIYEARKRPRVLNINVPIKDLAPDLEGFTIIQLTDIHVGITVKRGFVETIVETANGLKGDIIAFTGDLVDGSVPDLKYHVAPMSELNARYGKYFITGNHEYYSGAKAWCEEAKNLGYDVLINEHRVIRHNGNSLILAGVTDVTGGSFYPEHKSSPKKAIEGAPQADIKILLAHQPRSLYEAVKYGYDLQISGHTHGGQFIPWNSLATIGQPFIKGLHKMQDTWIYVSQGTGYWGPPVRFGAPSEITVIKLVRG